MAKLTRRGMVAGAGALAPSIALAQAGKAMLATPPSVITNPPRDWSANAPPDVYPDPDIIVIDNEFRRLLVNLSGIHQQASEFIVDHDDVRIGIDIRRRVWSGEGQYVVF